MIYIGTRLEAFKTLIFGDRKQDNKKKEYAPTSNGNIPSRANFGSNIYASDIIVQAIRCKANEFKKLIPRHIRTINGVETVVTDSNIARLLRRPNEYMTTSDFFEKITIMLELNKNVFIYPSYVWTHGGDKYYTGLYPLNPLNVEYLKDQNDKLYIRFTFGNGYVVDIPNNEVIHWRKDYGVDDYFGGRIGGENTSLLKLLREYDEIVNSIAKSLNIASKINGIVKMNTYLADEAQQKKQEEFNNKLVNGESGFLFIDEKAEIQQFSRDIQLVDKDTMEYYFQAILRNTGVSLSILNGDYTAEQKEAFYEHALEADIKNLAEAMEWVLFSERAISHGNGIGLYPAAIKFMTMDNKLKALEVNLPAGILMKDEARWFLGLPPLPNGQGQVIAQGYNLLLDENNNNKVANKGGEINEEQ